MYETPIHSPSGLKSGSVGLVILLVILLLLVGVGVLWFMYGQNPTAKPTATIQSTATTSPAATGSVLSSDDKNPAKLDTVTTDLNTVTNDLSDADKQNTALSDDLKQVDSGSQL